MADLYTGGATVAGTIAYFNSFVEILVADGDSASPVSIELTDSGTIDMTVHLDTRAITLQAFTGDDHITTSVGDDLIFGNDGNDTIIASEGNDTIYGGAGDDSLIGGLGNDVFVISDELAGQDTFLGGSGSDEVQLEAAGPLAMARLVIGAGSGIETLNFNGVQLGGTAGADLFDLSGVAAYMGDATIDLVDGQDSFKGAAGDDHVLGGADNDSLLGNNGNDWLEGGTGDDTLVGGAGDDVLVLGAPTPGRDSLSGGTGIDRLLFDQQPLALTRLILNASASVETLESLVGTVAAGDGDDFWDLSGVTSYATPFALSFGLGNDVVLGSAAADSLDGGDGRDSLTGNAGDDSLSGGNDNDTLLGGAGDDSLVGNAGNDSLDGGLGTDRMAGGAGNDLYRLSLGDSVVEAAMGGTDTVILSGVTTYRLAAQVENLQASGSLAVTLRGNALGNTITSGSGNDRIDGDLGADTMAGGAGDDVYTVDAGGDVVIEASEAGIDGLRTNLSQIVLFRNVENLTGTSTAGQALTGNGLDNVISASSGADTLFGGGGEDVLKGGAGADLYTVNSAGDRIVEGTTGGIDSVTTALASYTLGRALENLTGTRATGQTLSGNVENNRIAGSGGADTLDGRLGNDSLTGGAGADHFVFSAALGADNIDRITDFTAADRIVLENSGVGHFNGLALGVLTAEAFKIIGPAGSAVDSTDRILYNSDTGALYFDPDGAGGADRQLFARLEGAPTLTFDHFLVI